MRFFFLLLSKKSSMCFSPDALRASCRYFHTTTQISTSFSTDASTIQNLATIINNLQWSHHFTVQFHLHWNI